MVRRPQPRRGVVILIVLSLLVLFVLLVVTFAIVAGQYRRAAQAVGRQEWLGLDPAKDLDKAFYQLLRDTTVRSSAVRFHSLLRDMYGSDGFRGYLAPETVLTSVNTTAASSAVPPTSTYAYVLSDNELMDLVVNVAPATGKTIVSTDGVDLAASSVLSTPPGTLTLGGLSPLTDYYNGCILTVLSGTARGVSTRIVGYRTVSVGGAPYPCFRIVTPRTDSGLAVGFSDLGDQAFLVNGRPFSGTGAGLNYTSSLTPPWTLNAPDAATGTPGVAAGQPVALVPNYGALAEIPQQVNRTGFVSPPFPNTGPPLSPSLGLASAVSLPSDIVPILRGGNDESYDAAEFQNMALGLVYRDSSGTLQALPSFHRPGLILYGASQALWSDPDPQVAMNFQRRFSLRPVEPSPYGKFDGSNPSYSPVTGPWDVDNDGDGLRDSIWIDLGMPIQTSSDGRRYKPLFAILCLDMDGRLNVNAHDRLDVAAAGEVVNVPVANDASGAAQTTASTSMLRLAYGPPGISLPSASFTSYSGLLTGRYGLDGHPGWAGSYEYLAQLKFFEEPENYFTGTGGVSSYFSPSDLRLELRFGLDAYGQPKFSEYAAAVTESRADSPWELNLIQGNAADTPYTPAELEPVLRRFDYDRTLLPPRLADQITSLMTSDNARILTTASFDVPMPGRSIPNIIQTELASNPSAGSYEGLHGFIDLLKARLLLGGVSLANLDANVKKMLSTDLAMGLRMNINRPLGDGRDSPSAANLVVDEFGEQSGEQVYGNVGMVNPQFAAVPFWHANGVDVNGDGAIDGTDQLLARQLLARHFFVLTLALSETPSATVDPTFAKMVAQWAINAVDFRDADSIMSAFEYDPKPFNGWTVDGNLGTDEGNDGLDNDGDGSVDDAGERGLVWGCERPELLLTEAIAYHARRTTDTASEVTDPHLKTDVPPDADYDQPSPPFGTAFVELYNPWTGTDTQETPPGELRAPAGGVLLSRTTPSGNPVWRLTIVNSTATAIVPAPDPDNPSSPLPIDRVVYFVAPTTAPGPAGNRFYTDQPLTPIQPGRYAVVGGGYLDPVTSTFVSRVGEIDPAIGPGVTDVRRVVLAPGAAGNQVTVYPGNGAPAQTPSTPAVAIAINVSDLADPAMITPRSFNVTEPVTGYPLVGPNAETYNPGTGRYEMAGAPVPLDAPLDNSGPYPAAVALTNGTVPSFCRVYLQRLANPTQDYSPVANPFRTIDTITMDMTAFSGMLPFATDTDATTVPGVNFSCLQRGDADPAATPRLLWRHEPARTAAGTQAPSPGDVHFFPYSLSHTLGGLNTGYLTATPPVTFPWLVWNNRPYVSQYELMQVPFYNSWELLQNFSLPSGASPYAPTATNEYAYLPNFFSSGALVANLCHIFDLVHVPSRFLGTETVLNPNYFGKTTSFSQPNGVTTGLLPPFNVIPSYREPGRVNLNTTTNDSASASTVYNSVVGTSGPAWGTFVSSRAGFSESATVPTMFGNPFRPAGCSHLVPLTAMNVPEDVETTFLRSADHTATSRTPQNLVSSVTNPAVHSRNSYFRYDVLDRLGTMATTRSNVYAIWITVGYFEVEPNLIESPAGSGTWIINSDEYHPDGLRVAQEVGLDIGTVTRHRGFYIIDRTIPVAFDPGQNQNVDKCVLLRRFIE